MFLFGDPLSIKVSRSHLTFSLKLVVFSSIKGSNLTAKERERRAINMICVDIMSNYIIFQYFFDEKTPETTQQVHPFLPQQKIV